MMDITETRRQKRMIRNAYSVPELRAAFRDRSDEELFFEIGAGALGPVKTAALQSQSLGHLVVWCGYEYLTDFAPGNGGLFND